MRIGLTGGTGFLGQTILEKYSDQHSFVVPTSDTERKGLVRSDNIKYVRSDYSSDSYIRSFEGCDAVIHAGATVPTSAKGDQSFFIKNIESSVCVFEACSKLSIRNVINISSGAVYDHANENCRESDRILCSNNAYGTAKRCVEEWASYYNKHRDMNINSLRVGKMLGLTEKNQAFWLFLNLCRQQKPIQIYGKGLSGYDYVYVKDVCAAALYFIDRSIPGSVVNISYGELTRNRDFIPLLCNIFQNEGGFFYGKTDEPMDHFYMNSEFAREQGWSPAFSIPQALEDIKEQLEGKKGNDKC